MLLTSSRPRNLIFYPIQKQVLLIGTITSLTIYRAGKQTTPTGPKLVYDDEATGVVSMSGNRNKGMMNVKQ